MKLISNSVGAFLTGTAIADAVMQLHVALARHGSVDLVDIPFLRRDGSSSRVQMAVGRDLDVVSQDCGANASELQETPTTKALEARALAMCDSVGVAFTADELSDISWDEDTWLLP